MNLSPYVGIPFVDRGRGREGCDCWGLVRLVYADKLGIDLPDGAALYPAAEDRAAAARVIAGGLPDWRAVERPQPGDVALLAYEGVACHVGVLADLSHVLHTRPGRDAVIEPLNRLRSRLVAVYRYQG